MNIQLKQRLVGAIVLVALAVIFIPMLLPGSGSITGGISGSNIPAEPDYRFSPTLSAPKAPPIAEAPGLPMDNAALARATSLEETIAGENSKVPGDVLPASTALKTTLKPKSHSSSTSESAVAKKPVSKPANKHKPAKPKVVPVKQAVAAKKQRIEKSPKASGWVVQVGSFSSAQNAKTLRDKLRKQGNASFVENSKNTTGRVYRVRVGPLVSRKAAEKLRLKLAKASGLKGLVQAYP
ncbi:MAG: SPOR domain-containing protein [Ectothiorhodospiraceae bacterium]|nr:SPOR domain-containing protein [Ectothiorhodospiraceae bacterium]